MTIPADRLFLSVCVPETVLITEPFFVIISSFYSLRSTGHPWRASKRCDLHPSPWPHSSIFLYFLFRPLLSFATFSSAYLFFHIPEDSNPMQFSLLAPLTYSMEQSPSWETNQSTLQLVKKFPAFMEPESSSSYPQVPATCPYPEPTPSSPHDPLQLPEDPS